MGQRHVDALFTTRWAGRDALLYVLMEHQSTPDPLMAFRMLRYQVRIWERHIKLNPKARLLPVIVPVVIYQGQRRWNVSTEFADLLDVAPDLLVLDDGLVAPGFRYLLDDLSGIDAPELRRRPLTEEARVGLVLLGLPAGFEDLDAALGQWLEHLALIRSHPGGLETLGSFATYIGIITGVSEERMGEFMATMEPEVAEAFVSLRDQMIARGRAEGRVEGRVEGRAEGHAEMLLWQLDRKFGDLDERVKAAVSAASPEQLASWMLADTPRSL